jgi:hypothetical protein
VRGLASAVLAFQAIVIALAIPVAVAVYGVDGAKAGWVGGVLSVSCLVVIGMLGRPWAYVLGWVIQVLMIMSGFIVPAMFILGIMFAALWWGALRLGRAAA